MKTLRWCKKGYITATQLDGIVKARELAKDVLEYVATVEFDTEKSTCEFILTGYDKDKKLVQYRVDTIQKTLNRKY